ncbi:hypothetical protein B0J12DRAFT_600315 [Macrophomina phaseolina]|uniref:Cell wall protein PhiA n=1 Tax=Macrophomina phaseolina TaxID=35725 RepID=A0ABQ8GAR9_9PEZI|nr:hypothetical protein B0J12DRAFT_600315 [Macrophomina phaseolina]
MFFQTIIATLTAATAATAAPTTSKRQYFSGVATQPGSPIDNARISASNSSLWLHHAQDAFRGQEGQDLATFYLDGDAAYLYCASAPPEQLFVDLSGMGHGQVGYTFGAPSPAPRNSQRNGFAVDADGRLTFDRTRWWACPTGLGDGSYGIWLNKGSDKCVGFVFRVEYTEAPVGCLYSHRPAYEAMLPAEGFWEPWEGFGEVERSWGWAWVGGLCW